MTIRKSQRKSDELESLELFAELDEFGQPGVALNDARRIGVVVSRFRLGLGASLDIPSRVHGWRPQAMFPAIVLAIGGARLIKAEDAVPAYYFDDADGPVKAPDFRLISARGEHLAHYWAGPNLWTLVDSGVLTSAGGKMFLALEQALRANELGLLGDAWIGTTPPLVLTLVADPAQPRTLEGPPEGRHANFVVGSIEISCRGRRLETDLERRIAWSLMDLGHWQMDENVEVASDGTVVRVNYKFEPAEPVEESQGFAIVGSLSSLYSALYNLTTLDEAGEVISLRRRPEPDALVDLIPDDYWDNPDRALPLWRLDVHRRWSAEAG